MSQTFRGDMDTSMTVPYYYSRPPYHMLNSETWRGREGTIDGWRWQGNHAICTSPGCVGLVWGFLVHHTLTSRLQGSRLIPFGNVSLRTLHSLQVNGFRFTHRGLSLTADLSAPAQMLKTSEHWRAWLPLP